MAELIVRKEGHTGWLIFSNVARHNAMTYDMWKGMPAALADFDADPNVRVIALKGDGDKAFTIGISDYAQTELGDIVYVEVETVGEHVVANAVFGAIDAIKVTSELYMPVAGEVLEFNARLKDEPQLVNSDPYGAGWIIKVKVDNLTDLNNLMTSEVYENQL